MSNIKLLICYHKKSPLFKDDILTPIHVGRVNARKNMDPGSENYQWLMNNMIGDDTGENISGKNGSYNELTALYWAWKNYGSLGNPDYIGLMHYRRHFVLQENVQAVYNIEDFEESTYYDVLNYSEEKMQELVADCDFLTHIGKVKNVYQHYIENQRKEDIDLANEILLEKYPDYKDIMKTYYQGDYSNFCNMNIFSRELFFEYCEWIFSILEEFEKRVDISEKRFFISERLAGIFVAGLMSDKRLKYKILPIAFIEEPVCVPVAMWVSEENNLSNAVAVTSILENAKKSTAFHFYLFHAPEPEKGTKEKYRIFEEKYGNCRIDFISFDFTEELLPLYLAELLPEVKKCIYLSGQAVALFDIGEFYRICSTDDYFMVGVPKGKYDPAEQEKKISTELMVLNCVRLRKNKIAEKADIAGKKNRDDADCLNRICKGETGYIPWYLFTSERLSGNRELFWKDKTRNRIQEEALWRPFLIFDDMSPVENNQGVYSIFWWDMLKKVPFCFQALSANLTVLQNLYAQQQIIINQVNERESESREDIQESKEDWRSYGLWGKLVFYYKHNGLKNTFAYAGTKLLGKKDR